MMRSILIIWMAVLAGCGGTVDERLPSSPEEDGLASQIAAGRAGGRASIELFRTKVTDEEIELLSPDDRWLETLLLDAGELTDRAMATIAELPSLTHLRLRNSPITDAGFRELAGCESIRILNVPQCQATAEGIAALGSLPSLTHLRLGGDGLEADTAASVASIETLKQIHLIGIPIDDEGLRQIAGLPRLESLYVDDSKVTPEGWEWLFETHPEVHVHVNQRHLDRMDGHH